MLDGSSKTTLAISRSSTTLGVSRFSHGFQDWIAIQFDTCISVSGRTQRQQTVPVFLMGIPVPCDARVRLLCHVADLNQG